MTYTMLFALSSDLKRVLLLKKPPIHYNPLFRNRWTGPGGKVEKDETPICAAVREMREETGLVCPEPPAFVLTFDCNCDSTEAAHLVHVFGTVALSDALPLALGSDIEPVRVWERLPANLVWYVRPVLSLVRARLRQPL